MTQYLQAGNDKIDLERKEQQAKEKARAQLKASILAKKAERSEQSSKDPSGTSLPDANPDSGSDDGDSDNEKMTGVESTPATGSSTHHSEKTGNKNKDKIKRDKGGKDGKKRKKSDKEERRNLKAERRQKKEESRKARKAKWTDANRISYKANQRNEMTRYDPSNGLTPVLALSSAEWSWIYGLPDETQVLFQISRNGFEPGPFVITGHYIPSLPYLDSCLIFWRIGLLDTMKIKNFTGIGKQLKHLVYMEIVPNIDVYQSTIVLC